MSDILKFRPENTAPAQFMRPPTEAFHAALTTASFLHEGGINETARKASRRLSSTRGEAFTPTLRIGSELEVLLFSADSVPHEDRERSTAQNPNYSPKHTERITQLKGDLRANSQDGGLTDVLYDEGAFEKLFMEIRTKPTDVAVYNESMSQIQEWMQVHTEKLGIHPVIWSQHFHLSLTDNETGHNLLLYPPALKAARKGMIDIYHRALPLLRLPENVEDAPVVEMGTTRRGVRIKGEDSATDPQRLEGRMNNSDYAFDPHVNLLYNLIGMKRGLEHIADTDAIDADFPLGNHLFGEQLPYFLVGRPHTEYNTAILRAIDDQVLQDQLPQKLHEGLLAAIAPYWDISTGKTEVSTARNRAYDIVENRRDALAGLIFGEPGTPLPHRSILGSGR